jgi:hemin uptake protein HemP
MTPIPQTSPAGPARNPLPEGAEPPRVRSEALLLGRRRLIIDHEGASYTLLLTRNGKLILTK